MGTSRTWTDAELDRFRAVQQLAYSAATDVAGQLHPGTTERDAAGLLRRTLRERGVDDWLHTPFAWFGDRTAFTGFKQPFQFFPTGRRLEDGMAFILDCAPIVDGYVADIGYADHLGANALQDQLIADLAEHRTLILEAVSAGLTLRDVYREVDRLIEQQGYENRHRVYPGRVIGHRVGRVTGRLPARVAAGFGTRFLRTLGTDLVGGLARGRTPLWADGPGSDKPVSPGLWAVEPHVGLRGTGAKFEELLVVTGDSAQPARWLDDDLPHVRRWARRGAKEAQPA